MVGHTPGEWWSQEVYLIDNQHRYEYRVNSTHKGTILTVARTVGVGQKGGEAEANARLAAAGPDMLQELKELRSWFRAMYSRDDSPEGMFVGTSVEKHVASIDATIAKAEGR